MSSNKNFSESTTYRYALALYELAKESSNLEKIEEEVMSLIELISLNADFRSLINDPTGKKKEQINIIRIICEKYKFNEILTKFLCFLSSNRRIFFLEKILKSFLSLCSNKRGEINATLSSSKKLNEQELINIQKELSQNFTSKVKLNYRFEPNLIGGLIIQVGSVMIDTSIKNKLKKLEIKMIEV